MIEPINKEAVELRRTRLTKILSEIVDQAATQSLTRCPYRNQNDLCTAQFRCQNQGTRDGEQGLAQCLCDGKLDYRSAWEVENPEEVLAGLRGDMTSGASPLDTLRVDAVACPSVRGKTMFELADQQQIAVNSSCGRLGQCHECVIEIVEGSEGLSPPEPVEAFLQEGYRLACQARCLDDGTRISFTALRRNLEIVSERPDRDVKVNPSVRRDGERVLRGETVVDSWRGALLGLAVDVGTTTISAELIDLETGRSLCGSGFENPQRFGGSDVISRISYDTLDDHGELQQAVIKALNNEILAMCGQLGLSRHSLYDIVVVGNTTMRDLFFGLDVYSIGQRPYKSLVEHELIEGQRSHTALEESARKLGITASAAASVYAPPLLASHLGSDAAAAMLAVDLAAPGQTSVLLDIGTNTEVVISIENRLVAASCPAGPAFEGGLVRHGVPACAGAIDSVRAVGDAFQYTTLGDAEPVGLCGSGLIDLLSELGRTEQMTALGVFSEKRREIELVQHPRLALSREDVSHLAQAKAASYCGQLILLRQLGLKPASVDRVFLAGGFAHAIDLDAAIAIGFLAPYRRGQIKQVGNAALEGARQLLVDTTSREHLRELAARIEHIELETTEDFFEVFVEACQFKPMVL